MTSTAASQQILVDVFQCLLWALPLGLLAHQWFGERVCSLAGWDGRPRPGTPADVTDALVAVLLIFLLRWHLVTAGAAAAADATKHELQAADVAASTAAWILLWLILLVYLRGLRQRGLTAWLGLPDARRMATLAPLALIWTVLGGAAVYALAWGVNNWAWGPMGFEPESQAAVRALAETRSPWVRGLLVVSAVGSRLRPFAGLWVNTRSTWTRR